MHPLNIKSLPEHLRLTYKHKEIVIEGQTFEAIEDAIAKAKKYLSKLEAPTRVRVALGGGRGDNQVLHIDCDTPPSKKEIKTAIKRHAVALQEEHQRCVDAAKEWQERAAERKANLDKFLKSQ